MTEELKVHGTDDECEWWLGVLCERLWPRASDVHNCCLLVFFFGFATFHQDVCGYISVRI